MSNDTRSFGGPWLFFGIVIAAILVSQALQGRDQQSVTDGGESTDLVAIMGKTGRVSEARAFRSARLTAVMGKCSFDLTRAMVVDGTEADVEIVAVMGNVTLRVPDGWVVDTHAIPVLGGVRDLRSPVVAAASDEGTSARRTRLTLRGFVMMGSLIIKS